MKETFKMPEYNLKFSLSARLDKIGVHFPNNVSNNLHNSFRVFVIKESGSFVGKTSFLFYDSTDSYERGNVELEPQELLFAFRSFLEDGRNALFTFNEFCDEFGYSNDSISSKRIWLACQKARDKARIKLDLNEEGVNTVLDYLSSKGVE